MTPYLILDFQNSSNEASSFQHQIYVAKLVLQEIFENQLCSVLNAFLHKLGLGSNWVYF